LNPLGCHSDAFWKSQVKVVGGKAGSEWRVKNHRQWGFPHLAGFWRAFAESSDANKPGLEMSDPFLTGQGDLELGSNFSAQFTTSVIMQYGTHFQVWAPHSHVQPCQLICAQ
jgi:hypothetical protein